MDAELKAKWVKALRSGEYKQGTSHLKTEGRYCCLGVLAECAGVAWDMKGNPMMNGESIRSYGSEHLTDGFAGLSDVIQARLANLNDEGASFRVIADHIERNL
jgi:hypothetical protein